MAFSQVIGNHATNVNKGCADYVPPATPTVTSTMHSFGYFTAHFGKWHIGDSAVRKTFLGRCYGKH